MARLTDIELLTLAQTGLRLGLSRGAAYKAFERTGHVVERSRFERAWTLARQAERAFPPLPTKP